MHNPCSISGCTYKPTRLKKGMCLFHYERHRNGIPLDAPRVRLNGEGTVKYGYLLVTRNGRQVPYHRIVMEEKLGRPLERREVVHHIDGDKLNNAPENLELLTGQPEHLRRHWEELSEEEYRERSRKISEARKAYWRRWRIDNGKV